MENTTIVIEGYMGDGIDRVYTWGSVQEALDSGRFEYLEFQDLEEFVYDDLETCQSVEELINLVGYPFEVYQGELNILLGCSNVQLGLE